MGYRQERPSAVCPEKRGKPLDRRGGHIVVIWRFGAGNREAANGRVAARFVKSTKKSQLCGPRGKVAGCSRLGGGGWAVAIAVGEEGLITSDGGGGVSLGGTSLVGGLCWGEIRWIVSDWGRDRCVIEPVGL